MMAIPDFGEHVIEHQDAHMKARGLPPVQLSCRYVAPGLTMQDLMSAYHKAEKELKDSDRFSGNPSVWPGTRGVRAVLQLVLQAVYKDA